MTEALVVGFLLGAFVMAVLALWLRRPRWLRRLTPAVNRAAPSPAARLAAMEEVAASTLADMQAAASGNGPVRDIGREVMRPWHG